MRNLGAILAVYLAGLFIGGIYVGMVAPVRTVIQENFGIDDALGIWMINIYTLFYAALIPIIGKLADRNGRKSVFTACVGVFCAGSAICGLAASWGGFPLLLVGRIVQAVGASGMIPVANAEMGTAFPPQKRGMALGLAAGVSGISNMLGSAVGSAILGITGNQNWSVLFYIAVPFCLPIIIGSVAFLPRHARETTAKMDLIGSVLLALWVFCLLLGITNMDSFTLEGILTPSVLVCFAAAIVAFILFIIVERRAQDPVFHLEYFSSRPIVVTMAVSFFIGCCIVSMMLIPQFAENALGLTTGSGGFYVLAIGILSLIGPPVGGKLIDKIGPKPVLMGGLAVMAAGFVYLAMIAAPNPTPFRLISGLAIVGLGMGFAMGAPTNYMILSNTREKDASSAIASIALVRQIGTTVSPAILVGFISAEAGLLGYQHMLLCVAAFSAIALILMVLYRPSQTLAHD